MSQNKDLEYYMNLPYAIEIIKIPKNKGGGYMACLPQFGRAAIVGDGETLIEAIEDLEEGKRVLFEEYIEKKIPFPDPDTDEEYSGRLLTRLPIYLHRELALTAKKNKVSLNSFITSLLSGALKEHKLECALLKFESEVELLRDHICELKYIVPLDMIFPRNERIGSDDLDDPKAA